MSSFLDLPDELILKVLSYAKIRDLLSCGQVSKRIRSISYDNSLFQNVDLSGKYVKSEFLEFVLNKDCKRLNFFDSCLWGYLYLDSNNCKETTYYVLKELLLASCFSLNLKKTSLKSMDVTPKMIASIFNNSETLQLVNIYYQNFSFFLHGNILGIKSHSKQKTGLRCKSCKEKQNGYETMEDSDDGDISDSDLYSGPETDEDESDSGH